MDWNAREPHKINAMENNKNNMSPHVEEMKRLVKEKAESLLKELTEDNLNYFKEKASTIAEGIMEKYVFSVYDMFTTGEFSIKDLKQREVFTNYRTGYQQKMLGWIEQNKPKIELMVEIPSPLREQSGKKWHYVTLGIGTTGAVALAIGRCWWTALAVEMVTLAASYFIYKIEKGSSNIHEAKQKQFESDSESKTKKGTVVNETISQLEKWLKEGEAYSNELLTTFNL